MVDRFLKTVVSSSTTITTISSVAFSANDWTNNAYTTPPAEHPVYTLVGQVTAGWSRLEHALDRIIWSLAGTPAHEGGCITSQLIGARPRYLVIIAQLNLRKDQGDFARYIDRVDGLMRKSFDTQEKRNRLVHDAWYLHSESQSTGQFRSWPRKDPQFGISAVDLNDIETTIAEATKLAQEAEAIFAELLPRIGQFPRPPA